MKEILIASKNVGKITEILEVLGDLPFKFVSLNDFDISQDVEEDGETYKENAKKKAEFFSGLCGLPTIADDSGIVVDVLKGELGVKTRRWGAGENASDKEWLDYFLKRMEKEENRGAEFFSTICFYDLNDHMYFSGKCRGNLLYEQKCESLKGIPLSSVFVPEGFDVPYSMLGIEEKNSISHRGKAAKKLREYFEGEKYL